MVKNLRLLREQTGKSQREVADEMSVNYGTYFAWENGNTLPNSEVLVMLADYFNVTLDFLVGRETRDGLGAISKEQYNTIKNYLVLSENNQVKVAGYVDSLLEKDK